MKDLLHMASLAPPPSSPAGRHQDLEYVLCTGLCIGQKGNIVSSVNLNEATNSLTRFASISLLYT